MLRSMLRILIETWGLSTMRPPHICVDKYESVNHICQDAYERYRARAPDPVPGARRCHAIASSEPDGGGRSVRLFFHRGPRRAATEDFASSGLSPQGRTGARAPRWEVDALLHRAAER